MRGPLLAMVVGLVGLAPAAASGQGRIAVDVRAGDCPTPSEVTAALEARLPGVTARPGATPGRRLEVAPASEGQMALRLRDRAGALELERSLTVSGTAGAVRGNEACQAVAEAVALVVVRYLQEIGYRPPALEAPPPPASIAVASASLPAPRRSAGLLGAGGAARVGLDGAAAASRGELLVDLAVLLGPVSATLGTGASSETAIDVPGTAGQARLRLRAYPVRLALGLPIAVGPGALVPSAGVSLDVLSFRATGLEDARQGVRFEPAAEVGASYLMMGRRLFARGLVAGGLTLAPRDFSAGQPEPIFRTPGAYLRATVELGLVLWKNWGPRSL